MKVLYLHDATPDSEQANLVQVRAMCTAMTREGHDVTLSLPSDGPIEKADSLFSETFKVQLRRNIVKNQKIDKYINGRRVREVIASVDPDICYVRSFLLLKEVLAAQVPVILELHNNRLHDRIDILNNLWKKKMFKAILKERILKVVCISNELKKYWVKEGIPSHKIIVAHDAIDPVMFSKSLSQEEARKALSLPADKKIVTYTGRLYENRKISNILELAERIQDCNFLVVGGPEEQAEYYRSQASMNGLKNIRFFGQVPHSKVPLFLFASDVLLGMWSADVPTINYCSPLKLFEYMAAGRIIVVQGFKPIKEVLTHNQNALIVEPESFDDLYEKTLEALKIDLPATLTENCRKLVFQKFTWNKRVDKIFKNL